MRAIEFMSMSKPDDCPAVRMAFMKQMLTEINTWRSSLIFQRKEAECIYKRWSQQSDVSEEPKMIMQMSQNHLDLNGTFDEY